MAVETATTINELDATKPGINDLKSEGDDHIRLLKSTVKATFPNITGAVTATHTSLNTIDAKAPLASPTFTGTPAAPTAAASTNTTQLATTAFVQGELTAKAPLASPAFTGTPTAPTPATADSSTKIATTAHVQAVFSTAPVGTLPSAIGNAGKVLAVNVAESGVEWVAQKGPLLVAQYTASGTFNVPASCNSIRAYAFGAGAAGTGSASGGGGGCAYGDIAVTPGDTVTLTIASGVATVTHAAIAMLTANPASGVTGGTASKHVSVTNGGAYSGGAGSTATSAGGASSGSPLGVGVAGGTHGGSGWGGAGPNGLGGGVGGAGNNVRGGDGLPLPSADPLLNPLTGRGSGAADGSGAPGGGGGDNGAGGFGGGGGSCSSAGKGEGGFGGGGGGGSTVGGNAGFGGGGGRGSSTPGAGGAAVIRIYY